MDFAKKLVKTDDRKINDHMHKVLLKSKIRKQTVSNIRRYTAPTQINAIEADEGEHLLQYRQAAFKPSLSTKNAEQIFNLELEFGEYINDYSLNGRSLMLASDMGHVALMDWKNKNLSCEFHVKDLIRDCKFIHSNFIALAQNFNAFIYDNTGLEIHQLTNIQEPHKLEYLPYHYLLAALSKRGKLTYIDVSMGSTVAEIKTHIQEVS